MRDHAVGRWQKAQALKVWTRCGGHDGKPMALECLQADFVAKLRNRTRLEMAEIEACRRHMPSETLSSCLGLETLGQRKLYKKMEDGAFVYRSIYHEHLQHWLKFLPPAQLLVLPSEALFDEQTIQPAMARLARFLGLPANGAAVHSELLFKASTASTSSAPHDNGREYSPPFYARGTERSPSCSRGASSPPMARSPGCRRRWRGARAGPRWTLARV